MTDHLYSIQTLKARYCRLMDTKQWQDWGQLFTDDLIMDCSDDVTPDIGEPIIQGRAKAVAQVESFVGPAITVHQVHAPEIILTSETTASGIWAMSDVVTWQDGNGPVAGVNAIYGYGHYHEEYRLEGGKWKISSLKLTRLYVETR
jgi:hypothetical protein